MASWALNQVTAPDNYADAATLDQLPILDHVNIDVTNQGIYWQVKQTTSLDPRQGGTWNPEVYMAPGSRTLQRAGMVGLRFRAAIAAAQLAGTQAIVTVECVQS